MKKFLINNLWFLIPSAILFCLSAGIYILTTVDISTVKDVMLLWVGMTLVGASGIATGVTMMYFPWFFNLFKDWDKDPHW